MRILYITPTFQHPKVRGSLRHYYFLRELGQRHAITLLTLERSQVPAEALAEMATYTERILTFPVNDPAQSTLGKVIKRLPLIGKQTAQQLAVRAAVQRMKAAFARLVREEKFDLILFHGKDCFPVIAGQPDLPLVIDFCDATSFRVRSKMRHVNRVMATLLGLRYLQVRQIERQMIAGTPHVAFISQRDRTAILGAQNGATVIPNGIELAYWTRRTHTPTPNCLIFTGVMDYAPNEDAALHLIDHILPHVRPHVPDLKVLIAGRNPTPALRARAARDPDVTVTGFVEDMRDYLEQATLFVAPLRFGAGMQNKLQEALAMEVPVVTSSVAAHGLRVAEGDEPPLVIADQDEAFATQIIQLLNQPAERARLAREGRRFAQQHFDWGRSAQQLEQMCSAAIKNGVSTVEKAHFSVALPTK